MSIASIPVLPHCRPASAASRSVATPVQSMTNTIPPMSLPPSQVAQLWRAGSELVRLTVNNAEAAAVQRIRDKLAMMGGSAADRRFPPTATPCLTMNSRAEVLATASIRQRRFRAQARYTPATLIEFAIRYAAVRIGTTGGRGCGSGGGWTRTRSAVPWMQRRYCAKRRSVRRGIRRSVRWNWGLRRRTSCCRAIGVDLIAVYRHLAARCDFPLHLGPTEAGMGKWALSRPPRRWRCC